jgi:thiol-disulfide isomerase/thioredoxin
MTPAASPEAAMRRLAIGGCLVLVLAPAAAFAADEESFVRDIQRALQRDQLEAAEKGFAEAVKAFPDSVRVNALRLQLVELNAENEHWPEAIGHVTAYIDHQFGKMGDLPSAASDLPGLVALLYRLRERSENIQPTIDDFDRYLKRLSETAAAKPAQELTVASAELTAGKISWLTEHGQHEAAQSVLDKELAEANQAFTRDPQDPAAVLRLNAVLRTRSRFAADLSPDKEQAWREQYLTFLSEHVRAHPEEVAIVGAYLNGYLLVIQGLALTEPDTAEKLLKDVKSFVVEFKDPKPAVRRRLRLFDRNLASIGPVLESARAHLALVGQKGALPETESWLNGGALSADDLKGKVVLLDFWAVWCGPCIATFPHLREWHEKFADKGLVIVGVTHWYSFDWDDETSQIKRVKNLPHEEELAATEKFLRFHKLQHRIAVTDEEDNFDQNYLVEGIPQAVLLDRQGNVRLIRVGAGKRTAHDLERMIERLLSEPAKVGG